MGVAGLAGCEQQHRVTGGGVAVDRDAIKAALGAAGQHVLQQAAWQVGVGHDEGEHRCHVRRNHAAAFGKSLDGHGAAFDMHGARARLWKSIGRHNAAGGGVPAIFGQTRIKAGQGGEKAIDGECLTNHAGAGDVHLMRLASGQGGNGGGGLAHDIGTRLAREHIGIARVHHQRAARPMFQRFAAPIDRRAGTFIAREHACGHRARRQGHHDKVRSVGIADASRH